MLGQRDLEIAFLISLINVMIGLDDSFRQITLIRARFEFPGLDQRFQKAKDAYLTAKPAI